MEQLTDALRHEQSLLERMLFKLVETRLLLGAGEVRFLADSAREAAQARRRACNADLGRAAIVGCLRPRGRHARTPTLRELAADAPEPWARMLRDHHDALTSLVGQIEVAAHHNARFAHQGLAQVAQRLPTAERTLEQSAARSAEDDPTLSLVADDSAYRSVLGAADSLRMPALLAFLL
ncbi:MAG: flagellar export chaperone FlgN [Actinomycetota bacterium]|nr:flagellar export chaperone FlgN [Actinomycetota bacterium]